MDIIIIVLFGLGCIVKEIIPLCQGKMKKEALFYIVVLVVCSTLLILISINMEFINPMGMLWDRLQLEALSAI